MAAAAITAVVMAVSDSGALFSIGRHVTRGVGAHYRVDAAAVTLLVDLCLSFIVTRGFPISADVLSARLVIVIMIAAGIFAMTRIRIVGIIGLVVVVAAAGFAWVAGARGVAGLLGGGRSRVSVGYLLIRDTTTMGVRIVPWIVVG